MIFAVDLVFLYKYCMYVQPKRGKAHHTTLNVILYNRVVEFSLFFGICAFKWLYVKLLQNMGIDTTNTSIKKQNLNYLLRERTREESSTPRRKTKN
jgi:hypothetical protein